MKPVFCTLFDRNYLARGLAFYESLHRFMPHALLQVLALDKETAATLRDMKLEMMLIKELAWLEGKVPALESLRQTRTLQEYCWTLTPFWMQQVMRSGIDVDVVYMDADSYLFGSLEPLYDECAGADVSIVPHRFPEGLEWREHHNGKFNVNFVYVKATPTGRACLADWTDCCKAWCYARTDRAPDGTLLFGDQGYLDSWEADYGAHSIEHIGANLAPWNQQQYEYVWDSRLYAIQKRMVPGHGNVGVKTIRPVLFYHFHGIQLLGGRMDYGGYAKQLKPEVKEHLYEPYIRQLVATDRSLAAGRGGVGATPLGHAAARR